VNVAKGAEAYKAVLHGDTVDDAEAFKKMLSIMIRGIVA
jgi:hypothetical protein